MLFYAHRRPVIAVLLHEQLNVGQGTLNLIGSEQISQLKLRGVRDLSGGGPIGDTLHGNAPHKVIRNGKERQHNLAVRSSFGLNTDVGKAPRAMKLVNAFADKFTVKRLPYLLGNELQPSLLIDVGRYVGPADVRDYESLVLGKGVIDRHGWRLRFNGLTWFLRGGLRRRLHGTHRRERQRNQRCQQSPPQLQTGSPIRCSWLISSMNAM